MPREKNRRVLEGASEVIAKVIPDPGEPGDHAIGRPRKGEPGDQISAITRGALGPIIALKDVLGFSRSAIARRFGLSDEQVERYMKTPGYPDLKREAHDRILNELDSQIGAFLRDMLIENYRELHLLAQRNDTRPDVKAKIRQYLIDKAEDYINRNRAGDRNVLREIYEATQREHIDGTFTKTLRRTVERPALPTGGSQEAGPDGGAGVRGGNPGAEETSGGPG